MKVRTGLRVTGQEADQGNRRPAGQQWGLGGWVGGGAGGQEFVGGAPQRPDDWLWY